MAEEFYLDTSIWLDFFEKRGWNGEQALKLVFKIIEQDFKIVYSDLTIQEFKGLGYNNEQINSIFSVAKPDNIERIHIYKKQTEEAMRIAKERDVTRGDAIHAILARDNDAQLISRDSHYEKLKDITTVKNPEDFI